jgi:hypothetical protein
MVVKGLVYIAAFAMYREDGTDSHKLTVRFARLMKDSFNERMTVFKEMRDFYRARSQVVHGNNKQKNKALEKINLEKIEDYLRDALKAYTMKAKETTTNHDQIIEILDLG